MTTPHGPRAGARRLRRFGRCLAGAWALACSAPRPEFGDPRAEIAALLARSAADWNRGDLDGFMSDYARDSATSYVSGGHVQYGWQRLYDRYRATYFTPGAPRDSLAFEEVRVRPLTPSLALCTARFKLLRRGAVTASGPFTLLLEKRGARWYILHDHTSSDPAP
jgi:ketosteroid isomerase-like protein